MISFTIENTDLRSIMSALSPVAKSASDSRPAMTFIQFNIKGNTLIAVACDGYLLSIKRCRITNDGDNGSFLMPSSLKINTHEVLYIPITCDGKTVNLTLGTESISLRVGVNADFLDWRNYIPKNPKKYRTAINPGLLAKALKASENKKQPTMFYFSENPPDAVLITQGPDTFNLICTMHIKDTKFSESEALIDDLRK